jgi:hypothetical protein
VTPRPKWRHKRTHEDPVTFDEWQEAVNLAEAAIAVDSARVCGTARGGPSVNLARARELLRRGRALGIHPAPDAIRRFMKAWNVEGAVLE